MELRLFAPSKIELNTNYMTNRNFMTNRNALIWPSCQIISH